MLLLLKKAKQRSRKYFPHTNRLPVQAFSRARRWRWMCMVKYMFSPLFLRIRRIKAMRNLAALGMLVSSLLLLEKNPPDLNRPISPTVWRMRKPLQATPGAFIITSSRGWYLPEVRAGIIRGIWDAYYRESPLLFPLIPLGLVPTFIS